MKAEIFILLGILNGNLFHLSAGDLPDAIFQRPKVLLGRPEGLSSPARLAINGDIVYVADGPSGLAVFDIADPEHPRKISACPVGPAALTVWVSGHVASVSTTAGMVFLDVRDPSNVRSVGRASGAPQSSAALNADSSVPEQAMVAFVGDRVYISREKGVAVLQLRGLDWPALPAMAHVDHADPNSTEARPAGRPVILRERVVTKGQAVICPMPHQSSPADDRMSNPELSGDGLASESLVLPVPPLALAGVLDSGVFRLLVSGYSGQVVRVQRSSNLLAGWEDWRTIALGNASVEVTDPDAAGGDQIFYRAVGDAPERH